MSRTPLQALRDNFLGSSPVWYKQTILAFLVLNPLLMLTAGPAVTGWLLVGEFIFTLAMALRCYPLQPGGLLAIEAVAIGLTSAETVRSEVFANFPVILLLMFMVAGIYFMRELLLFTFTKILLGVRSKLALALMFSGLGALLSAFLDALTVVAVVITVAVGFYSVYHRHASGRLHNDDHDNADDDAIDRQHHEDLEQFRAFLRSLMMHAGVGTALGGVCTLVGEPQNLLIGHRMDWDFVEFAINMAPVTGPVLVSGLLTCALVEQFKLFGYGATLPDRVRTVLSDFDREASRKRDMAATARLVVQGIAAVVLVAALALHIAEVGLIGLLIIVLQTAFNGVTEEHRIGHAFAEALPFTALLVVFFAIVAVIHDQHLFKPVIEWVLTQPEGSQPAMFYLANGALSAVSDNVFVATIYINEVEAAFKAGAIDRPHFEAMAIAINTGTNIPSVATPNGQAAFLFLLTSSLAPLIRLSYVRMVVMALPYAVVMTLTGLACVVLFISA